ncbi:hypothetical protein [Yokenella regensburgei]|uniref:hypothetical protein n=1 Tax=Yokenella regensburgei TaxID=158877 RepID=UPI000241F73C|nr:hypothetical protein [Yokenella regensburgei]EHM46052.1 hypothetical protein HMPREF0880_04103 [Yokenella regensburgei ATCC 43003]QIU89431.1 hypothetical protein HEC60_08955 [Yokenella regensburgei]
MIPTELARTQAESRLKRICFLAEARYWRSAGNKKLKQVNLSLAKNERISSRDFLGNPPF